MAEFRQALFKKGYVFVIIGGGITGDIQINDTNCHGGLKKHYRDLEMKLMLENSKKIQLKFPLLGETRSCLCFCRHGKHLRLTLQKRI